MPLRRSASRLVALVMLGGLCVGCTSTHHDTAPDTTAPTPATTTTGTQITLTRANAPFTVRIGQLGDGLHRSDRRGLRTAIGTPVETWFDGGFLKAQYPTSSFPDAFGSWTPRAARLAEQDKDVTTDAILGPDLVALVADRQRAILYVFAHAGVTGGATARVRLAMTGERQDGSLVRFAVSGDLYLTRAGRHWSIFGYDLHRTKEAS